MWFDTPAIRTLIDLAFAEDIGTGDAATDATVDPALRGVATVTAKAPAVFCGGPIFAMVMTRRDPAIEVEQLVEEGARVQPGTAVLRISGPIAAILTAERPALNFLGRLSGIATFTARCVAAVRPHPTHIVDTRKTLPGFRALDKYAVRTGGGRNHRTALDAGILVKENHIMAAGSVAEAVRRARDVGSHLLKVELEVETLDQLDEAVAAGAEVVMLDNMDLAQMTEAVRRHGDAVTLEASGNMTLDRLAAVAATGVQVISLGALTHSVTCADFSLRLSETDRGA